VLRYERIVLNETLREERGPLGVPAISLLIMGFAHTLRVGLGLTVERRMVS
jgi:hypothetical protein